MSNFTTHRMDKLTDRLRIQITFKKLDHKKNQLSLLQKIITQKIFAKLNVISVPITRRSTKKFLWTMIKTLSSKKPATHKLLLRNIKVRREIKQPISWPREGTSRHISRQSFMTCLKLPIERIQKFLNSHSAKSLFVGSSIRSFYQKSLET